MDSTASRSSKRSSRRSSKRSGRILVRFWAAGLGVALITLGYGAGGAAAAAAGGVTVTGTLNGHPLTGTDESHPLRLSPSGLSTVVVEVANNSSRTVDIRTVVLQGQVIGLTFFDFETSVDLSVKAHHQNGVSYLLDLSGLNGEATGLIPGSLSILGPNRNVITSDPLVTDVRGSIVSVYGLFGLGLLLLTLLALASTLLSVARHKLSSNRFRRALSFMVPGVGLGFVLVFTLSALRVWLPSSGHWLTIVLAFLAVFFAAGFLSPSPAEEVADEDLEKELAEREGEAAEGPGGTAERAGAGGLGGADGPGGAEEPGGNGEPGAARGIEPTQPEVRPASLSTIVTKPVIEGEATS